MKQTTAKASTAQRKGTRAKKTSAANGAFGAGLILAALACVAGAVIVIAAREGAAPAATSESSLDATDAASPVTPTPRAAVRTPAATTTSSTLPVGSEGDEETALPTTGRKPAPVTIAGCLERAGDAFRLKDATGVDVPKARSWKSGFLKKGTPSIALTDTAPGRLRDHLGERVSVTGVLADREMQVRSLHRLAASCR
jgi:hypothetical protein